MQNVDITDAYSNIVYHQDSLMKKEGLKTWVPYWAVIRGQWLLFYEEKKEDGKPTTLIKTLELTNGANCSLVPRRKRRFPFCIDNGHATYYFKCDTELKRYSWIFCILLSSTGKAPKPVPKSVPKDMLESVTYPRMAKFEKKIANSNKKLQQEQTKKGSKMGSEHRIKYAKRLELKARKSYSHSDDSDDLDDDTEPPRPHSARSVKSHEKNKRKQRHDKNSYGGSANDIRQLRRTSSHSSIEIHAQVHSPPLDRPPGSVTKCDNTTPVLSILEIEDDDDGTVHVISQEEALPNVVVNEKRASGFLSARNNTSRHLKTPGRMIQSHSLTDLGQTNHGINIDEDDIIVTSRPSSASNRSRTGLSGMKSPNLSNKKDANAPPRKLGQKHYALNNDSPRSPVPKSRYARYNIPSSEA